jgi:hypothetical protein
MSFVAVAVVAVGTAVKVVGDVQKASAQEKADQFNANIKSKQALEVQQQATEEARISRAQSSAFIGQQKANYGASGVGGESGSVHDVIAASATNAELDALNIQHKGDMQAWSLETGASQDRLAGENAKSAGGWSVASDIAGGASSMYGKIGGGASTPSMSGGSGGSAGGSYSNYGSYA